MSDLAERIFGNARLCNLSNLPTIESHVHDTIDAMRLAQDHPTFIFNFSMVNRTLGDIQQLAHAILSGTHPMMQQSSELLMEGLKAFFEGLDPVTQVKNIGHLAMELGSFLDKGGSALWNDPIMVLHNGMNATCSLIDLIRGTAYFTSDLTVGKLYLSPEEYKQRTDSFCSMIEPLRGITGKQCFQFAGQLAADVFFMKGLGIAYTFLKEIDALEKLGGSAARLASALKKGFDAHLADNPVVITAEGIVLKMSNGMKDFNKGPKEIINSTKTLLESVYAPIADILKTEIIAIKKKYDGIKNGFAQITNKITMECKHILGMELDLSKKGKLTVGGFHHDLKNTIEKTDILRFTNRVSYEHGFYKATLFDGENFVKNVTFFPAEWSRDTVVSKIYEAYDNFIKSGATGYIEQGNKYVIRGKIKEGIEIEMYITKNGNIVTAYPILESV